MNSIWVAAISVVVGMACGIGIARALHRPPVEKTLTEVRLRELQLDLDAAGERIRDLEGALRRERTQQTEEHASSRNELLDELADTLSQPVAFLAVQISHVTNGTSADLTVNDMAMTGNRILQALQSFDISVHGAPGDQVVFDPDLHMPATGHIEPGTPAVLLVPSVEGNRGRLVRRGVVEAR